MDGVNRTLYIPLYGKAAVSRKGILLHDPRAEEIWGREGFALRGKAKSRWLTYYMGMRAAVFDRWLDGKLDEEPAAVVLHIGCGLDSRIERVGSRGHTWYDIDFPDVIAERRKYFRETECYHMLGADARETGWLDSIPRGGTGVVVMEGVSMYLRRQELTGLLAALDAHFSGVCLLADCYTEFAAKASKYKNPVNEVGVTQLYGVDDPGALETGQLRFLGQRELTPEELIRELSGFEQWFFRRVFAGGMTQKIYRLYEYGTPKTED